MTRGRPTVSCGVPRVSGGTPPLTGWRPTLTGWRPHEASGDSKKLSEPKKKGKRAQ